MPSRNKQLALIHIAKKQLRFTEQQYRIFLQQVGGVDSAKDLDEAGRIVVIDKLREIGFNNERLSPQSKHLPAPWKRAKTKAVALWIALHRAGEVKDFSHQALGSFVARVLGKKVVLLPGTDPLDALDEKQIRSVIEQLKAWCKRTGVVLEEEKSGNHD